jgi:D-alanyl-lipoteichoic acid acyltransferase DltB (MBOAT superfamily)
MFDRNNGGLYAWQFPCNFLVLRIISYSVDYHNACRYHLGTKHRDISDSSDFHRPLDEYRSVVYFLSYLLYTPLYMAGPIMSFNAFMYSAHHTNSVQESKF